MRESLLWQMLTAGQDCGLNTVEEAYENLNLHYDMFMNIDNANQEFRDLHQAMADNGLLIDKQITKAPIEEVLDKL